jgi:uncharacterized protein (TIGR02145 family)
MKNSYTILFLLFISTCSYSQNPCQGTPTVGYAGKTYHTVQIGSQCWLKENLDVGTRINGSQGQTNNSIIEKYCYNDNTAYCDTFGGLYQWNEAMQYVTNQGAQGICPTGWHIPTEDKFASLEILVKEDGNKLKAKGEGIGSGAGTNTSVFSALLSGYRGSYGVFRSLGYSTTFWSSSEYDATKAYDMYLDGSDSPIAHDDDYKVDGFSVRCLKD